MVCLGLVRSLSRWRTLGTLFAPRQVGGTVQGSELAALSVERETPSATVPPLLPQSRLGHHPSPLVVLKSPTAFKDLDLGLLEPMLRASPQASSGATLAQSPRAASVHPLLPWLRPPLAYFIQILALSRALHYSSAKTSASAAHAGPAVTLSPSSYIHTCSCPSRSWLLGSPTPASLSTSPLSTLGPQPHP